MPSRTRARGILRDHRSFASDVVELSSMGCGIGDVNAVSHDGNSGMTDTEGCTVRANVDTEGASRDHCPPVSGAFSADICSDRIPVPCGSTCADNGDRFLRQGPSIPTFHP